LAIPLTSPYFIAGAMLFAFCGSVAYFWMSSFLFGAGYQGAPRKSVEAMLRLSDLGPNDRVYELGAGLGAVTFPAAREKAAHVVAVEIEPIRYLMLRARRALGPAADHVDIRRANMFGIDLRDATVISAFLWPGAMAKLRPKFEQELRPGTRVVSRCHPILDWTPTEYDREADVYLYRWPESARSPAGAAR
jgi:SAM-dependent methyltransferase